MVFEKKFMSLFAGNESAYGVYEINKETQSGKKVGKAETRKEQLTLEDWKDHLSGKKSIGVVPIKNDSTCVWGCIDIDKYGIDHESISKRLFEEKIPMLTCTTKSKGAHLFVFFETPISAELLQNWLKTIAAGLGFGTSEIFPKQTKILTERGDVGNWLNMPYFGGSDSDRYCVSPNGKKLSAEEFLKIANKIKIDPKNINEYHIKTAEGDLEEGPPCLQILCKNGFPEGTRNNGLFNITVFAKKKFPERWKEIVERFNQEYMSPALPSEEVQQIIKQHEKKEYLYKCNEPPICHFCNSSVCRVRKFGVGAAGAMPTISGLTKLETEPPIWFLTVEGQRIEINTDALLIQDKFHKVCIEQLNIFPPKLKVPTWQSIVQNLLDNVIVIDQPEDVKTRGIFSELLEGFTTAREYKERKQDLLRGLPYTDTKEGVTYFKLKDFMRYAKIQGTPMERNFVAARIRDFGAVSHQMWIQENKSNATVWKIPMFKIQEKIDAKKPKMSQV